MKWLKASAHPRKAIYECKCGVTVEAFRSNVGSGHTRSCGCVRRQVTSERATTHGHKKGGRRTRVYAAWVNMKSRCNNESRSEFKNYGGRGITYARAWEKFETFLADMGEPPPGMTLERTNNSRGYSAKNCRWATRAEQNLNKRNCVRYALNGKSQTLAEWSRETGIQRMTLLKRIQRGVPLHLALTVKRFLKMPRNLKETA